jgi:hypothetical protein
MGLASEAVKEVGRWCDSASKIEAAQREGEDKGSRRDDLVAPERESFEI